MEDQRERDNERFHVPPLDRSGEVEAVKLGEVKLRGVPMSGGRKGPISRRRMRHHQTNMYDTTSLLTNNNRSIF